MFWSLETSRPTILFDAVALGRYDFCAYYRWGRFYIPRLAPSSETDWPIDNHLATNGKGNGATPLSLLDLERGIAQANGFERLMFCLHEILHSPQATPYRPLVFQHGLRVSDRHSKIGTAKIFHNGECYTDHAPFAVN